VSSILLFLNYACDNFFNPGLLERMSLLRQPRNGSRFDVSNDGEVTSWQLLLQGRKHENR